MEGEDAGRWRDWLRSLWEKLIFLKYRIKGIKDFKI